MPSTAVDVSAGGKLESPLPAALNQELAATTIRQRLSPVHTPALTTNAGAF